MNELLELIQSDTTGTVRQIIKAKLQSNLEKITQKGDSRTSKDYSEENTIQLHILCLKYSERDLKLLSIEECNQRISELFEKFSYYMEKIYPDGIPKIEKGDRLACDGYLILASDIFRYLISVETNENAKAMYTLNLYYIMEWYEENSRWNFDLTLRQAELYSKLFLVEDSDELFKIKDLKGNQYDTISHIFYRNHIKVGLLNE